MVSVRQAKRTDIEHLKDFQKRMAMETENIVLDDALLHKGLMAMFDDPHKGLYYVAEDSGQVVGCHMITYEWSDWRNGNVWWLQSLYVLESHRKKGAFKAMYDNLVNLIKDDPGVRGLRLYVDKTNKKAQEVYAAMGMNGEHYTVFEWMKS